MENNKADKIAEIHELPAIRISLGEHVDKKTAENVARAFPQITNANDGRAALFPIATVGKLLRHRGFDFSRIIGDIPRLYETSILGWSEPEIPKAGHKEHTNIKGYHHYLNRFTDGTNEYYIRFTLSEVTARRGRTGRNIIHSAAISDIAVYKKSGYSQQGWVIDPVDAGKPPFVDKKLQAFFNPNINIGDF